MAWCEQSCICSRLFASAASRTAGLAVSSSVLAQSKARHIQQSKEAAERGCLARKAQACSEALLHNMAAPAGEMPQLCTNSCCLLWITAVREERPLGFALTGGAGNIFSSLFFCPWCSKSAPSQRNGNS